MKNHSDDNSKPCLDQTIINDENRRNDLLDLDRRFGPRLTQAKQFLKFAMVGCSGMVVDFGAFFLMTLLLSVPIARGIAIWIAMSWNFALNRKVTFTSRTEQSIFRQYLGFCLSCLVGAISNWTTFMVLSSTISFFGDHQLIAAAMGVAAGTAFNFILCSKFVFRSRNVADVIPFEAGLSLTPEDSEVIASEAFQSTKTSIVPHSRAA